MECNIGKTDKIIRFILGFIFLWLGLQFNALFYILSIIFFATAIIGFCPINKLLKINTCKKENKSKEKPKENKKQEIQEEYNDSQNNSADESE